MTKKTLILGVMAMSMLVGIPTVSQAATDVPSVSVNGSTKVPAVPENLAWGRNVFTEVDKTGALVYAQQIKWDAVKGATRYQYRIYKDGKRTAQGYINRTSFWTDVYEGHTYKIKVNAVIDKTKILKSKVTGKPIKKSVTTTKSAFTKSVKHVEPYLVSNAVILPPEPNDAIETMSSFGVAVTNYGRRPFAIGAMRVYEDGVHLTEVVQPTVRDGVLTHKEWVTGTVELPKYFGKYVIPVYALKTVPFVKFTPDTKLEILLVDENYQRLYMATIKNGDITYSDVTMHAEFKHYFDTHIYSQSAYELMPETLKAQVQYTPIPDMISK